MVRPASDRTGSCFIFINSRFVASSLRRSFLLPKEKNYQSCFLLQFLISYSAYQQERWEHLDRNACIRVSISTEEC